MDEIQTDISDKLDQTRTNFKDFVVQNGIVSTAASITIGFATATFVKSFVADVVMPVIFIVVIGALKKVNSNSGKFLGQFLANKEFRFTNFISELVTWVLIVLAAFLILDLVVRKTIGSSNNQTIKPIFSAPTQQAPMPQVTNPAQSKPPVSEEYSAYQANQFASFAAY
jgi:large-conductance mechanosensitive channel